MGAMVIRNDGEILWASDDAFKEHLQEKAMVRVVNQECEWRVDEQQKLLQGGASGVLEGADNPGPNPAEAPSSAPSGPVDSTDDRGAATNHKLADQASAAASRGAAAGGG